ncbi:hypothetical protein D3C86_1945240 [compost metagenome]
MAETVFRRVVGIERKGFVLRAFDGLRFAVRALLVRDKAGASVIDLVVVVDGFCAPAQAGIAA